MDFGKYLEYGISKLRYGGKIIVNKSKSIQEFKEFLANECWDLTKYKTGKYDEKIFNWFWEQSTPNKTEDTGECECNTKTKYLHQVGCRALGPTSGVAPKYPTPESEKLSQDFEARLAQGLRNHNSIYKEENFRPVFNYVKSFISQEIESSNRRLIEKAREKFEKEYNRKCKQGKRNKFYLFEIEKLLEELKEAGDE